MTSFIIQLHTKELSTNLLFFQFYCDTVHTPSTNGACDEPFVPSFPCSTGITVNLTPIVEFILPAIGVLVNSTVTFTVVASPAVKLVLASSAFNVKYSVLLFVVATDKSADISVLTFCTDVTIQNGRRSNSNLV